MQIVIAMYYIPILRLRSGGVLSQLGRSDVTSQAASCRTAWGNFPELLLHKKKPYL